MSEKQRIDRPWREYPIGTLAHAVMGGHWERKVNGWSWNGTGPSFPTPGGDAVSVTLPTHPASQESAGEAVTKGFPALLHEAGEIVRGKFVWKRFISGTPLDNDVPVWMAEFALSHIATLTAELAEAREQRDRWKREAGENMDIARDVIAERDSLRDECERLREAVEAAMRIELLWLPACVTEPHHDEAAALYQMRANFIAALSASGREGE